VAWGLPVVDCGLHQYDPNDLFGESTTVKPRIALTTLYLLFCIYIYICCHSCPSINAIFVVLYVYKRGSMYVCVVCLDLPQLFLSAE
jgi:hypothetical protein